MPSSRTGGQPWASALSGWKPASQDTGWLPKGLSAGSFLGFMSAGEGAKAVRHVKSKAAFASSSVVEASDLARDSAKPPQ